MCTAKEAKWGRRCNREEGHDGEHREMRGNDGYVSWERTEQHARDCYCRECVLQAPWGW